MRKNQTKNEHLLEEPVLKTYKWSCILIRLIFQMLLLFVLCDEEGNQKQRCGLWSSTEVSPLRSLQSRLPVEGWGISLWSLSTQHSTFIINRPESLPPSQLSQLQLGPCDCCLSHLTLHWLALMSLSTRKSRGPSLNRAEGDYVTACLWGWNIFFLIYMFNSYFILLSGDFGPCFSQGLATLCSPITATRSLILLLFHLWSLHKPAGGAGSSTRGLALLPPGLVAFPSSAHFMWRTPRLTSSSRSARKTLMGLVWGQAAFGSQMLMFLFLIKSSEVSLLWRQFRKWKCTATWQKYQKLSIWLRSHKSESSLVWTSISSQVWLKLLLALSLNDH